MARMVNCVKLGREAEGLDLPPVPGALGKRIFDNVSKEAWQQWVKYQTMLINENRLNLMDARARKYLAEQMEKHFFEGGADQVSRLRPAAGVSGRARRHTKKGSAGSFFCAAEKRAILPLDSLAPVLPLPDRGRGISPCRADACEFSKRTSWPRAT
jgi:Fe-S cluster biosynthesis and repair protein YggX